MSHENGEKRGVCRGETGGLQGVCRAETGRTTGDVSHWQLHVEQSLPIRMNENRAGLKHPSPLCILKLRDSSELERRGAGKPNGLNLGCEDRTAPTIRFRPTCGPRPGRYRSRYCSPVRGARPEYPRRLETSPPPRPHTPADPIQALACGKFSRQRRQALTGRQI
jgi:hypothetical protein